MQRLSICVDIDGTITDEYYWLKRATEYFNLAVKPEDVLVYDIKAVLGISVEQYNEFYAQVGTELHRDAEIRSGVKPVIDCLYDDHQIHFVSARSRAMLDVSIEWLKRHRIPMDSISLLASHDKVSRAIDLYCDIFIEDRYETAIQLAQAGIDVLLINTAYNQGILPGNVTRVSNWYQIKLIIDEISSQFDMKLAQ